MIVQCRIFTNDASQYLPERFKKIILQGTVGKQDAIIFNIPLKISRGYSNSGMKFSEIDQDYKLGLNFQNFYIDIFSHYKPIVGTVIKTFDEIELYVTDIKPLT